MLERSKPAWKRAVLVVLALACPPAPSSAQPIHPYKLGGRWAIVNSTDWGGTGGKGTHAVLLRGNADSSWVLHFDGKFGNDQRLLLVKPDTDSTFGVDAVLLDSSRVFCSGHCTLADGHLFVAGGEVGNHSAPKYAYTFDPRSWWNPSHGWTRHADMFVDRRYPTAMTLPDGNVLVSGGQRFFQAIAFGGLDAGSTRLDEQRPLNLSESPSASADPTTPRPAGREGHSAVFDGGSGQMWIFGGHDAAGPRNDLWGLVRTEADPGERWGWTRGCDTCSAVAPPARSRHSAVMYGDTMVVFGGLDAGGSVLGDVWRYVRSQNRWLPLSTGGGPRRYGHTAILVPGRSDAQPPNNAAQMLVFGGRDQTGGLADSTVWALSLPPSGDGVWRALSAGPGPPAREGHVATLDGYRQRPGQAISTRRMIVFGGQGRGGLLNDTWVLARQDLSTSTLEPWSWSPLSVTGALPPPRTRHAAIHDTEWDRLLVVGGDVNGSAPGGLVNEAWAVKLNPLVAPATWQQVTIDSVPSARAGHSLVFHTGQVLARVSERFTPATESWQLLGADPRYLQYYPHLFVTTSGKLFYSGNTFDTYSGTFDPLTHLWSDEKPSLFAGGFSVMLRPDTVIKCGGDVFSAGSRVRVASIDPATAIATWQDAAPMPEARAYQSLVLLPTGGVMMVSGSNGGSTFYRNPRLWNSANAGAWSDTLAAEPANRQYHSAAVLLPDSRVLCSSGPPSETQGTIFWPPYLFNRDGTRATRPVITSLSSDSIPYGGTITVGCDTAGKIGIVCLIRPGAATHQMDVNQRFVRLAFSAISGTELSVTGPPSARHAPPGDYLLFLAKTRSGTTDSIPSVARWVRVGSSVSSDVDPTAGLPGRFALDQSLPNPAGAGRASIRFDLPVRARVELEVLDLQGRRVRILADRAFAPGRHEIEWDIRDPGGRRVRPGIYLVRMGAGEFRAARKMVVL